MAQQGCEIGCRQWWRSCFCEEASDERATVLPDLPAPVSVTAFNEQAAWRCQEFFTANIRNRNTGAPYARAASAFLYMEGLTLVGPLSPEHDLSTVSAACVSPTASAPLPIERLTGSASAALRQRSGFSAVERNR